MSELFDLRASLGHALSDLGAGWNEDAAGHIRNALERLDSYIRLHGLPDPALPNLDALEEALADLESMRNSARAIGPLSVEAGFRSYHLGLEAAYDHALSLVGHAHNALRLTQEASE